MSFKKEQQLKTKGTKPGFPLVSIDSVHFSVQFSQKLRRKLLLSFMSRI